MPRSERTIASTMRVLYLHQYFVEPTGSGGTRSYEFARRLVDEGHQVRMVTSTAMLGDDRKTGASVERFEIDGIDVAAIDVAYGNQMRTARRLAAFAAFALRSIREAVRGPRPDVIVATSTPLTIVIPGWVSRLRHRAPLVFEVRDLWPAVPIDMGYLSSPLIRWPAQLLERFAYRVADAIIALSPGMADGVREVVGPDVDVTVVPNASDLERFDRTDGELPVDWPAGTGTTVLYAGTLGRANDVGWLTDVAAELPADSDIRFVIIGDGAERAAIAERAADDRVAGRITMLRPIAKQQMPAVLAATALALSLFAPFPTLGTTSPNKLFDALAARRAVAINYAGWQESFIEANRCGLRLDRDPVRAAAQIDGVARSGELAEMGRRARAVAEREFARDLLYRRWQAVLAGVVDRRS